MSRRHSQKKKTGWTIVLIVALLGMIACVSVFLVHLLRENESQETYEEVAETVKEPEEPEEIVTVGELEEAAYDERDGQAPRVPEVKTGPVDNPIDFKALKEINPDIYAWIVIEDTAIDYPVACREGDDTFYLHHDLYGDPKYAGCIYSEDKNAKDFSDPLTVLYGHNMRNGSMFQNLHKFENPEFFDKHPEFYVYTANHRYTYRVFAAYAFDNRHLLNALVPSLGQAAEEAASDSEAADIPEATGSPDDTNDQDAAAGESDETIDDSEIYADYFKAVMDTYSVNGNCRKDVELDKDSKVLTLSTCIGGAPDRRLLVQAVLIEENETR